MDNTNVSTELFNCTKRGVFRNFPIEWEIAKWIRCTELFITVLLNILLILLLLRKGMKSNLVFFVFHLAISDLAVAFFHILPLTIRHFKRNWTLGLMLCKLHFYISDVALYVSTYLIVVISIDRFLCIIYPMSIIRKMKSYRLYMVTGPWMLSFLINIPFLFWTTVVKVCEEELICTPDLRGVRKLALYLNAVFLLFLPSIALIYCYTRIVAQLCRRNETIEHLSAEQIGLNKEYLSYNRRSSVSKAKRKSTAMTFVVSLTFIICWMPFIMAGFLNLYSNLGFGGWFDILIALAPLNSMLNPIIFCLFNAKTFTTVARKVTMTFTTGNRRS